MELVTDQAAPSLGVRLPVPTAFHRGVDAAGAVAVRTASVRTALRKKARKPASWPLNSAAQFTAPGGTCARTAGDTLLAPGAGG